MKRIRRIVFPILLALIVAAAVFAVVGCNDKNASDTEYTLTFMNGSQEYATITDVEGADITPPAAPTAPSGKVFGGWSEQANGAAVTLPAKMPAKNVTYYALFYNTYSITLDAGEYGTVETTTIADVAQGSNLYELVKDITPTAKSGVDPVFAAWFYDGAELTSSSATRMPGTNITVEARYKVGYTVRIFKMAYGETDYTEDISAKRSGTDYVGKSVTQMPTLGDGFSPANPQPEGSVTRMQLSATAANNEFKVYYSVLSYAIQFNANAPQGTRPQGSMENESAPHGIAVNVPDSEYSIAGYRFAGWSETATGDVKYKAGSKLTATRGMVLYAVWDKGLRDATGKSNDLIFVRSADGEAYLHRDGIAEKTGKFYPATNTFRFTSGANVLLRGCVSIDGGSFMYTADTAMPEYYLLARDGSVGSDKLVLDDEEGVAVYKNKEGKYQFDAAEGALKFKSDDNSEQFCFRIGKNGNTPVFEIRTDEAGTYYSEYYGYGSSGGYEYMLDETYYFTLDGYGKLTMNTVGFDEGNDGVWRDIINTFDGKYEIVDAADNKIRVTVYADATNPDSATDTFVCRLDKAFDTNAETGVETHGYLKIDEAQTLYMSGSTGEGDRIELNGMGTEFEYYIGGEMTYTGSYTLNSDGTLELYDTREGVEKAIAVDVVEGEGRTCFNNPTEFADNLFVFVDYYYYVSIARPFTVIMRTYENGEFEIKFVWLRYDQFYNVNYLDIITLVEGNLGVKKDSGEDADTSGNVTAYDVYFVDNVTLLDAEALYYTLGILYTQDVRLGDGTTESDVPLYGYVSDYSSFVLYVYSDGLAIAGNALDVYGDEIVIENVTYKLDGMFGALAQGTTDAEDLEYYVANYGLPYLIVANSDASKTYEFFKLGGAYYGVEMSATADNASYSFAAYLLKDGSSAVGDNVSGKIVLMGYDDQGYPSNVIAWGDANFSVVNEIESNTDGGATLTQVYSTYKGTASVTNIIDEESYAIMLEYGSFKFIGENIKLIIESAGEDGTTQTVEMNVESSFIVVPEFANDEQNNLFVVYKDNDTENGDKLIIDYDTNVAYITDKDDVIKYSGEEYSEIYGALGFSMHGDYVVIPHIVDDGAGDGYYTHDPKVVKLVKNGDSYVDFEIIPDKYAGHYTDLDHEGAYIFVAGIVDGADPAQAYAVYFDGTNEIEGTYASTNNADEPNEFLFTATDGSRTFRFELGTMGNAPVMIFAMEENIVDIDMFDYDVHSDTFTKIGRVSRGEYDAYFTFEYGENIYSGYYTRRYLLPSDDPDQASEGEYYVFTAVSVSQADTTDAVDCYDTFAFGAYYDADENEYMVMLDETFGVYYYIGGGSINSGIAFVTGYGIAQVVLNDGDVQFYGTYEYLGDGVIAITDGNEELRILCGYYSGIGVFYVYDETAFGAGTYTNEKYESITFDGYGGAIYVDAFGISHEGTVVADGNNYRFTSYMYGEADVDISVTLGADGAFSWSVYDAAP